MNLILKGSRLTPEQQEFQQDDFPLLIGRSDEAGVCVPDRWVSRRHCVLELQGNQVVVRDLESTHGTFVNDEPIDRAVLNSGDRISIGLTQFSVEPSFESPSASSPSMATAGNSRAV